MHFLFEETNTGEEFIVFAENLQQAKFFGKAIANEIAETYGEKARLICWGAITEEEAEASGLDEY